MGKDGPRAPRPSLGYLIKLTSLVCGLELCASASFTYIPPLLLKAGYSETAMSFLLGIGPFIALMTVSWLGEWSDRCRSRWGRRRPFLFVLSVMLLVSLLLIPYGDTVTRIFIGPACQNCGIFLMALGVVLLDYTSQVCFNPCEALMSDVLQKTDAVEHGFMVYSSMMSIGSCFGFIITAVDWSNGPFSIGAPEKTAFLIIIILHTTCVMVTLFSAKEPSSPNEPSQFLANGKPLLNEDDVGYETGSNEDDPGSVVAVETVGSSRTSASLPQTEVKIHYPRTKNIFNSVLYLVAMPKFILKRLLLGIVVLPYKILTISMRTFQELWSCPMAVRRLFLADLFSWTAVMCHTMYFTDFVGREVYGGNPDAPQGSVEEELYDKGVRMGSWGLFLCSLTAFMHASFLQQGLISVLGLRRTYLGCLVLFSFALLGSCMFRNVMVLNFFTSLSGVGFTAITSIPNTLITMYHENKEVYLIEKNSPYLRGIATDTAILDVGYYLSQILLAVTMGPLVDLLGSALPYMFMSALAAVLSVGFGTRVIFNPSMMRNAREQETT